MKTTWNKPTKYLFGVGFVLLGIFILHLSRSVIPADCVALIAVIVGCYFVAAPRPTCPRPSGIGHLCLAILSRSS
jgi:hypothetical protein